MHHFMCLAFQVILIICAQLLFCCCEGTSVTLSPLGMVSVCPGGTVLLTCERRSGSVLYWDVSVPHMDAIPQRIVLSQGDLLSPEFRIDFTEFNISRTSDNPLTSQLLISNVTTEINGSTIYCSEDGDEINAPMTAISIPSKDDVFQGADRSLNVAMVNQLLRSDDVTVTLQWPREPGAVYHVSVSPNVSHTELNSIMYNNVIFTISLTISYDIQYNVSIDSSLCGLTTTKVLNYVSCTYPPMQLLHDPVVTVSGSQDSPPIEGQFITYTCPPGFILTGPNASVCTGNGRWEPDPGQVDCIADCGVPQIDRNVTLSYTSTLEDSILILICENDTSTDGQILRLSVIICHNSGNWIPDPAQFTCSPSTTVPPGTEILIHSTPHSSDSANLTVAVFSSTIVVVSAVCSIVFLSIGYACGWFSQKHKKSHTSKAEDDEKNNEGSQLPPTPGPLYEELQQRSTPEHQDLVELKENVAYGPIVK